MRPELDSLCRKTHVQSLELDIGAQPNMDDIVLFISHKLRQLADDRDLGSDWPGEQLQTKFVAKAGGLFLWVATVYDYLRNRDDPTRELEALLSATDGPPTSAEGRMDELYAAILNSFDWTDASFVASYRRLMGTTIATKTPLTISAMKQLFDKGPLASDFTLRKLSPLLTGVNKTDHYTSPVRVLHQSLRDFLVFRAGGSLGYAKFHVVEEEHSQHLALLCLGIINRDLDKDTPGTGYLAKKESEVPGIPAMSGSGISEALKYACWFWQDHLLDVDSPAAVEEALRVFMVNKMVSWMEVMAACGRCRGLSEVRAWLQRQAVSIVTGPQKQELDGEYAQACLSLGTRLAYEDRREEALEVVEEAVALYQQLATSDPATFAHLLTLSLNGLSNCLSQLGHLEKALAVTENVAEQYYDLAAENPVAFMPHFAISLNNRSLRLSSLGRHEEALGLIELSVRLHQGISETQPNTSTADFAMSLNNLGNCLSTLGRYKEALPVMEQTVERYRQLAKDRPAEFTPELALSLNNLYGCLNDLNREEEAGKVIQEAVTLYQQVVADRHSTSFTSELAMSLTHLSGYLSRQGRHTDALSAIQKAVDLRRPLAEDRPAAFAGDLAFSLYNFSLRLSELNRYEEALPMIQEAVELRRQLALQRPAASTLDLAESLVALCSCLSDLGRHTEALPAIQKAIELYQQLRKKRQYLYNLKFKHTLVIYSRLLTDLGRHDEALEVKAKADGLPG